MLRRLELYDEAGADVLFPEALRSEDEMRAACAAFSKPVMANMAHGGLTPILPAAKLRDIGDALAIYPALTSLAAAAAMKPALADLMAGGTGDAAGPMFDFKEFCELIGFDEVWAFEKKWARG